MSSFSDLGVAEQLCKACADLGFKEPTEIQKEAIPRALEGRDIIGIAETGSGKTAAFVLPVLQALLAKPAPFFALVLAPTRELAYQIKEQFESLGAQIGVKCTILIGGLDMVSQSMQLAGKPHVIVATPGRILDHLENTKGFTLRSLKYLVFDEADRLLNMDFEKEMTAILRAIPSDRKTYLYSATMTKKVSKLKRACLANPATVEVSRKYQTVKSLRQEYIFVPAKFRDVYTVAIANDFSGKSVMIFTNTIRNTHKLELVLKALDFSVIGLHGKMPQDKRIAALNKFKSGKTTHF
ncbi:putative ATP-dependent RNA helicase ddx47, variant 3 [Bonamia ostreae]|uniref:ATP-dependent RNA helicase ddx47, variant 3 n=1 Tax=Bonamia ostreae TaxID=126728 RepID=A0ABV2ANH0_9EUKA